MVYTDAIDEDDKAAPEDVEKELCHDCYDKIRVSQHSPPLVLNETDADLHKHTALIPKSAGKLGLSRASTNFILDRMKMSH
jgi:hypothetical protein